MSILPDLSVMSHDQLIALVMAQRTASKGKLTIKVGQKGNICIYGLGRFPVSLYRSQMERLLDEEETIRAFIQANVADLAVKV